MQVENLLEMTALLRVFKLPNLKTCAWIFVAHQSSQEADVAGLLPLQGSLLHLWQVCAWSYGKGWSLSVCLCFPNSYVLRTCVPKKQVECYTYSRVLSPSTSGFRLPYPIPPCTSLYPVPAQPTWSFQSPHGIRNSSCSILDTHPAVF